MAEGDDPENPEEKYSRRKFLKTTGIAAAGLGLGSMASGLTFRSDKPFSFTNADDTGRVEADQLVLGDNGLANSFRDVAGSPPVESAVVVLESGTPTAYHQDGSKIAQDGDAGAVIQASVDEIGTNSMILIGPGEFPIDTQAGLISRMTVRGAGMGSTVFKCQSRPAGLTTRDSSDGLEYLTVEGITVNGQNQGDRTGLLFGGKAEGYPQYCTMRRCEVVNCGPREQDTTPSMAFGGGKNNLIEACRAENCSSVSIEIKIGKNPTIRDCVVLDGNYEPHVGFCHGISVEKSQGAIIENNYTEGSAFGPSINVNNVGDAAVHGNLVRDVQAGIRNANGSDQNSSITGNVIRKTSGPGINVKSGGSGDPADHLVANNTLYNSSVSIGSHALIYNNQFYDSSCNVRNAEKATPVVGNFFDSLTGDGFTNTIRLTTPYNGDRQVFANNYVSKDYNSETSTQMTVAFGADDIIVSGNYIGASSGKPVLILAGDGYGVVRDNYFERPVSAGDNLKISGSSMDGIVHHNVFERGTVEANGSMQYFQNEYVDGAELSMGERTFSDGGARGRSGTFTGDGTTGRSIRIGLDPEYVYVERSDGARFDVHSAAGNGFQFNSPSGELSLGENGFTVGDNSSDADPNTDGESYKFYAR